MTQQSELRQASQTAVTHYKSKLLQYFYLPIYLLLDEPKQKKKKAID